MDYQLKPLGQTCAATGEPLEPGSTCHSVLLRSEDGAWSRLDFSPEGWNGPPEQTVGHWTCRVPEAEATPTRRRLDPDGMMLFFERLTDEAQPVREPLRYVLALLLVRKRRLEIDGSRTDDEGEFVEFNGTHGEGRFEVRDPGLNDDEIRRLQVELDAHLMVEA